MLDGAGLGPGLTLGLVLVEHLGLPPPPFVHSEARGHPENHRGVFVLGLLKKLSTGWTAQKGEALENVGSLASQLPSPFSPSVSWSLCWTTTACTYGA